MSNILNGAALVLAFTPNLAEAEKMTFRRVGTGGNCSTCAWVAAEGEITRDTPDDFEKFISEFGPVHNLVINSPGGDLMAGMALGHTVRRHGISTIVGATITGRDPQYPNTSEIEKGYCFSACSYAFFGGIDRYVDAGDLGVHQFYVKDGIDTSSTDTQAIIGVTLIYLKEMGINSDALISANLTGPEEIYTYSEQELANLNIDNTTRASDEGWFRWLLGPDAPSDTSPLLNPNWNLTPYRGGIMLTGGFPLGGSRAISATIYCQHGGAPANLLLQERGELGNSFESMEIKEPFVTIGKNRYRLGLQDIDFQGINDGVAMVSINFPKGILLAGAGEYLEFSPRISNNFGKLLQVRFLLPQNDLMVSTFKNCISVN